MLKLWQYIRGIPKELSHNLSVCQSQWALYMTEIRTVIKPGIKEAKWYRKPHKASAYVEEFYDKCPRIAAYLTYPLVLVLLF